MPHRLSEYLRNHPIAITGLGLCGAAGASVEETWPRVLAGPSPAVWREFQDGPRRLRVPVCPAAPWEEDAAKKPLLRRLDRHVQLAHAAAAEAWRDAGCDRHPFDPARAAVVAGTSRGPVSTVVQRARQQQGERAHANDAPGGAIASLSGALSMAFGLHGPALSVSATCTSSGAALALAAQQILMGAADLVLAGGAEAPLNELVLGQLHSARVLGSHDDPRLACRPFDSSRDGTVLGEGAAFLVLEPLARARERGARVHALLAGWAMGSEGRARVAIDESGGPLRRIIGEALDLADLPPEAIGYVNLHGTGTLLNDRSEAHALQKVFGPAHPAVACSSTKAVTGHCMGASSSIEAIISILALRHGLLPPTHNCAQPDTDAPAGLIYGAPVARAVQAVMSNSSGFWGTHTSLVFTQPEE